MDKIIRIGDFKISKNEEEIVLNILRNGKITENVHTREFEKKWAEKIGTNYSIAVNSGTSALISGLYALKYLANNPRRKKVITSPVTYIADANSIVLSGLEPVFGDIDERTFSLTPSQIEKILSENNPKDFLAILPIHLMGYPCDMDNIMKIAKKDNLYVLEDCAQAHGSKYNGKIVGGIGDLSIFSFYVAHNIQVGELGAVNTNNLDIKKLVKKIKTNGRSCACDVCHRLEGKCPIILDKKNDFDPRFTHELIGFNFKTMDLIMGLGTSRIKEMDNINDIRKENVKYLNEGLDKYSSFLQLPIYSKDVSYLGYPIIIKNGNRSKITDSLEKKGIETRSLFGCIPLQQPSFDYLKKEYEGKLPIAEYIGRNGFYIGCHQYLQKEDLDYIISSFKEIFK